MLKLAYIAFLAQEDQVKKLMEELERLGGDLEEDVVRARNTITPQHKQQRFFFNIVYCFVNVFCSMPW